MGKYMREARVTGDVAVLEPSQSTIGVCTRAKTLALQRRQSSAPPLNSDSCYLQLRSRRLEKPSALLANSTKPPKRNQKLGSKQSFLPDTGSRTCQKLDARSISGFRLSSMNSVSANHSVTEEGYFQVGYDLSVEASFGENILEFEPRDRFARETTPCSLVRESDDIKTPSSTTRLTNVCSETRRMRNSVMDTREMDEFFVVAEQQQQAIFIEKYNFDVVNDLPLPGRYEWVRVSQ